MARRRILIVDDKINVGRELEARLVRLGYEVAAIVASGADAVTMAQATTPALVLLDLGPKADTKAATAAAASLRQQLIPVVFMGPQGDERTLRRNGSAEPFDYVVLPCSDRELEATLELALCRHDAEQAVTELEGFFAISLDMFCFLDFNGYFRRLNPAWERTLGFTQAELMARPFIEFVHPDDRERTLNQNAQVRSGGQARGFENRYRCKDGSYRWFLWNSVPHSDERVIYAVARDITARKLAEDERVQLVLQLEASLAEVRTLQDILPICSYCRKIRDDENYWHSVESYIARHTKSRFSHGICPSCLANLHPEFVDDRS